MSKGTVIAFSAGLLILYSLVRKQTGLGNLVFFPKNLKGLTWEGITPVMVFGLAVLNTSNQSFTLRSMAGKLYANNYEIGTVYNFTPQTILANQQSIVYINVRLGLFSLAADIYNAIKNKTYSHTLELESYANIDNLQIPVNLKFEFKIGQ